MIDFYTQLLRGETKRSAFNKSLKNQKIRYPNDPVHWAGFIMLD
jgi:CHAT domain-containing protein